MSLVSLKDISVYIIREGDEGRHFVNNGYHFVSLFVIILGGFGGIPKENSSCLDLIWCILVQDCAIHIHVTKPNVPCRI